jgi:hypothetical protein
MEWDTMQWPSGEGAGSEDQEIWERLQLFRDLACRHFRHAHQNHVACPLELPAVPPDPVQGAGGGQSTSQHNVREQDKAVSEATSDSSAGLRTHGDTDGSGIVEHISFDDGDFQWDMRFTAEFKDQLLALRSQPVLLRSLVKNLRQLAAGYQGRTLMKQLKGTPSGLQIFETPVKSWADSGRFLWAYGVDFSPRICSFTDTVRLWRICLQHDDVNKAISYICEAHRRGRTSSFKKLLQAVGTDAPCRVGNLRVPRHYVPLECDAEELRRQAARDAITFEEMGSEGAEEDCTAGGTIEHAPIGVAGKDSFNILKFYAFSQATCLPGQALGARFKPCDLPVEAAEPATGTPVAMP